MPSDELKFVTPGMFHRSDEMREAFQARLQDPPVNARYRSILKIDWAENDCRLDGVAEARLSRAIENHQRATALLLSKAEKEPLSASLIQTIHRLMVEGLDPEGGRFRRGEVAPLSVNHEPSHPAVIEPALHRMLEWTTADSFAELHPFQQSALVLIRLLDVYPFTAATPRTCRVFANLPLLKAKFSPAIFLATQAEPFQQAIEAGFAMDTSRLTSLIADSVRRIFEACLRT